MFEGLLADFDRCSALRTESYYFRELRGFPVPSSALMAPMTRSFVASIERFAREEGLDLVRLSRGKRKDERTRGRFRDWDGREGVLYVGKAQERAWVVRTERRHDPATGAGYPWRVPSTAMINQYYLYVFEVDFGPLFLKFDSSPLTQPTVTSQLHSTPTPRHSLHYVL